MNKALYMSCVGPACLVFLVKLWLKLEMLGALCYELNLWEEEEESVYAWDYL